MFSCYVGNGCNVMKTLWSVCLSVAMILLKLPLITTDHKIVGFYVWLYVYAKTNATVCLWINRKLKARRVLKKNPLKNARVMAKLNPYAGVQKKAARLVQEKRKAEKQKKLDAKRGVSVAAIFSRCCWSCCTNIFAWNDVKFYDCVWLCRSRHPLQLPRLPLPRASRLPRARNEREINLHTVWLVSGWQVDNKVRCVWLSCCVHKRIN